MTEGSSACKPIARKGEPDSLGRDRNGPTTSARNIPARSGNTLQSSPSLKAPSRDELPSAHPSPSIEGAPPSSTGDVTVDDELPPSSVRAGMLLDDKYQLLDLLSEGGMGALYVALNVTLDVKVAIKLLRASAAERAEGQLADRLLQEARAAARLGHPAIVRVFDFGRSPDGDPYIVMELLDGEDLRSALERHGTIDPIKAVRTLLPIIHALATAHENGVVHRDVKPANIFLALGDGRAVQPKLIDFGVAKVRRRAGEKLTWAGSTVGTPDYMSPEQALGEEVEAATDVWAVCVVLYELVTGTVPFHGKNHIALLHSITEDEPEPLGTHGVYERELWEILRIGLEKNPQERWASMRALGSALAHWLLQRGVNEDICGASLEAAWHGRPGGAQRDVFLSLAPESGPNSERATAVTESPLEKHGIDAAGVAQVRDAARRIVVIPPAAALPRFSQPTPGDRAGAGAKPAAPTGRPTTPIGGAKAREGRASVPNQVTARDVRPVMVAAAAARPAASGRLVRIVTYGAPMLGLLLLGASIAWVWLPPEPPQPGTALGPATATAGSSPELTAASTSAPGAATAAASPTPTTGGAPSQPSTTTATSAPPPASTAAPDGTRTKAGKPPPRTSPTSVPLASAPRPISDYLPPEL